MEVVKTEYAGHARELASTVEISTCPDGMLTQVVWLRFTLENQKLTVLLLKMSQEQYVLEEMAL